MSTPDRYLSDLIDYLLAANDAAAMRRALEGLLTPSEMSEISKRLQIARLLKQGKTQREVARELGVGIATVTRGARELKAGKF